LLKPLPPDIGAAFVIITHQHPSHTSLLPELLAKVTCLPVSQASDNLLLEPNHIYVNMPGCALEIVGGRLCISDSEAGRDRAIDHFLRFLAADQAECAVAVILSGANSDGTLGIKAVKAAGGMVMVQQPSEAKYNSMPVSAIATGLVDYVLGAAEMSEKLQDYLRGSYMRTTRCPEDLAPLMPEEQMTRILVRLRELTGHDFTGYKRSTMSRRIERRMSVHRIEGADEYLGFLLANPLEAKLLMQELLISVTRFFRDPEAFQSLADKALPGLLASRPADVPLRVWVPGCATGEEAYSAAITLHEQMLKADRVPNMQVFGTDLDSRAINDARKGLYPEDIADDVSPERLERYFVQENSNYRVKQTLREKIVFAAQNLLRDPPFTKLDLIVCRNVLIYLTADVQRRLLPTFHYSLCPGGLLFLGSSETIGGLGVLFDTVDSKWKIHRRKELTTSFPPLMDRNLDSRQVAGVSPVPITRTVQASVAAQVQRMLLARFAPASVVVDSVGNIIHVQGRTGPYLELSEGQPSNNIFQLAREGLGPALATALRQAQATNKESVRSNVRVRTNHAFTRVDIAARLIDEPEALRGLLLVTLRPSVEQQATPKSDPRPVLATTHEEELSAELQDTRNSLQATIEDLANSNEELRASNEELQSTNEELQSTNEELQSTNEELETSKEELQSLNEEMNTVNTEFQSKVESIEQSSNDLLNLLNSTHVACVFLDEQLKVKRYTEKAREVIRLIASDVGRPLEDLTTTLVYDRLVADCRQVLDTLVLHEAEVRDKSGHWHLLRILPYRTGENVIDGIVVTLVNIDRVKEAERVHGETALARDLFEGIVQTVREPLVVLAADFRVILANDAFHDLFHTRREETTGRLFFELCEGQWDFAPLRTMLEHLLTEKEIVTDFKVAREFAGIGAKTFLLNARRLNPKSGSQEMILLSLEEVSDY
jgi:two-component system CheB/CheR fusion protein